MTKKKQVHYLLYVLIKPMFKAPLLIHQVTLFNYTPRRFGARRRHRQGDPSNC